MPIVELYETRNKVKRIDAIKSKDEVYEDVKRAFKDYI